MYDLKLGHLRPAPLGLQEVGGLVGMRLVQLLEVALVAALREEALLVQQSHNSHGLKNKRVEEGMSGALLVVVA